MDMANVQLVNSIFPSSEWAIAFPYANSIYTHDSFLKAVSKFPSFCNETNMSGWTLEQTCRRELATVFAHWTQETGYRSGDSSTWWTQGLYYIEEIQKNDYISTNWSANAWPPASGK